MHCPSCKDQSLSPKEVEKNLVVAQCHSCEGLLVPLINYRYWLERNAASAAATTPDIAEAEDNNQAKVCPNCSRFLSKFMIGSDTNNKIELCNHCDQAWLDKGEWQLLKSLGLEHSLAKIFTDAWQYQVRKDLKQASLDKRYQKELGDDCFAKVKAFKEWLDEQPSKAEIRQYLMTRVD